jgi:hypothetical protein
VAELEQDFELFKGAGMIDGTGFLKWTAALHPLTRDEAGALRDLLWAEAASTRYTAALAAFARKTPIRDVFAGLFLGSREGGVLCEVRCRLSGARCAGRKRAGPRNICARTPRGPFRRRIWRRSARWVESPVTSSLRPRVARTQVPRRAPMS